MKVLMENWRRYMKEEDGDEGDTSQCLEMVREVLKGNQYLSGYAETLQPENLIVVGDHIFLKFEDTFKHVKNSHSRESDLPGSKFADELMSDENLIEMVGTVLRHPPDEESHGKLKWFNVEMKNDIGLDSLIKKDEIEGESEMFDFREKIGNNRGIPFILKQGLTILDKEGNEIKSAEEADPEGEYWTKQDVPTINAPLQPTNKVNLIVGDIGEACGKKVISMVTMFPGASEPTADNKKDYAELGYVFLRPQS